MFCFVSSCPRWQEPGTHQHAESMALPAARSTPKVLLIGAAPEPRDDSVASLPGIPVPVLATPWAVFLEEELWSDAIEGLVVVWHDGSMTLLMLWFPEPAKADLFLGFSPEEADLPTFNFLLVITDPFIFAMANMGSSTSVSSSSALSAGEDEVSTI